VYKGINYPEYLKHGNATQFIAPMAHHFCTGQGLDIGAGNWPLAHAMAVDREHGMDAMALPDGQWDFVYSSHCLEHLDHPIKAIEHWKSRIRPGGVLFLYLPHPDMVYWRPEHCKKHLHSFWPDQIVNIMESMGFTDVINSERDLAWGFAVVGFNGAKTSDV
jgi:SAM-dependent methyltransferase